MRLSRRHLLGLAGAALLPLPAARAQTPASFRRGGAVHTMMNWGALEPGDPTRYQASPFEAPRNTPPLALLRSLKAAGFDFIRLTLDPGPFLQLPGPDRARLERKLLGNVALLHREGFGVLVDVHPVEQVERYSTPSLLADLESPLFAAYTALLARLAGLLGAVATGPVMLELMNEPALRDASHAAQVQTWGAAQTALHAAARAAAPELPLLLTGGDFGGISGLVDLDPAPFAGGNAFFSFHYYMPLSFTHQGLDFGRLGAPASPYAVGLPYPFDARPLAAIRAAIDARLAADTTLTGAAREEAAADAHRILRGFLADAWTNARVERDLDRVSAWARTNGVAPSRILMGECGVTRRDSRFTGADPLDRRRWLADVTSGATARGFGWALWEINGREFGVYAADDTDTADPALMRALPLE